MIANLRCLRLFSFVSPLAILVSIILPADARANPHAAHSTEVDITESDPKAAAEKEQQLIKNARQLTFEGRRAGEGYFSHDGMQMVFQSERSADNPFFQIYLLDFETGDIDQVSPGHGKTTCAWIHPNGKDVLFASTQDDPQAKQKQADEIALREKGEQRRYSWDYDKHFDLFRFNTVDREYTNLTKTVGYNAEGSYSPDGKLIAFASNRNAYSRQLSAAQSEKFKIDPAFMIDLFIMNADGTNVRQLTDVEGYDGGPFFSPDGNRICWRRFSEDGATAEIFSMKTDGSDVRQHTNLGAMSWAPYYHPSGEYMIFTTNRHGFANFELYLVDAKQESQPVRATFTAGFDGLPTFTPDGKKISWTTNRTANKQSQIFIADWDHEKALKLLRSEASTSIAKAVENSEFDSTLATDSALQAAERNQSQFLPEDVLRHVDYLCRPELGGRLTGTAGEKLATAYVAAYFDQLGLEPAGDNGSWYQDFDFTSGVALGKENELTIGEQPMKLNEDWVPLSFSQSGDVEAAPVVFAGYGIVAPADENQEEYDSFVHLDVKDKWVMAFRFMPEGISAEKRQHLATHSSLRFKAMTVRDRGAHGLILVSGPNSKVKNQLIRLQFDGSLSGTSIPVVCVTDEVANRLLAGSNKNLKDLQDKLDTGEPQMGFALKDISLSASIDIAKVKKRGRNVLGRLVANGEADRQSVVVGAHIDHLGTGANSSSLARDDERNGVHVGADDNASGVAAMLEVAQYLSDRKASGKFRPKRDIVFAAWSGEEIGLIGSSHYVKQLGDDVYPKIAACLNMDMVGRLEKKLIMQGVGSSSVWRSEIERRNALLGLPITIQEDSYLPTDASVFFMHGVPILSAFNGSHSEYHTPRDTPDRLNYDATAKIANLMGLIARSLALRDVAPEYIAQQKPNEGQRRANLRAYLGTIPDYAEADVKGVKLSGVSKGGPTDKAGMKAGDVIVKLAGKKIENIYDYTYAIEALKIGQPIEVVVSRKGKEVKLTVTPGSRD